MSDRDWEIPEKLQPEPSDYAFDLGRVLDSVVGLRAQVPLDAFTAGALGTERTGSGVVIGDSNLIVTVGYLLMEAETIWITCNDGRALMGHALAVDHETGFGLVQPLGRLGLPGLALGDSNAVQPGDPGVLAAGGGREHAMETRVVSRQEFAGYWEYLLDDAIFAAPAHPFWGGTGFIGAAGDLLGIGSLSLQHGDSRARRLDMNMIIPIAGLKPILNDLITHGRANRKPRPWLGVYAMESDDAIVVGGLADDGPADRAGVRTGDRILGVGTVDVTDLAGLWRQIWQTAGIVRLRVARGRDVLFVDIEPSDRMRFLKAPRLH